MNNSKNLIIWAAIIVAVVSVFNFFQGGQSGENSPKSTVYYSDFINEVDRGQISEVEMRGKAIIFRTADGSYYNTYVPEGTNVADRMQRAGVRIKVLPLEGESSGLFHVIISSLPTLILLGVWLFFFKQMQAGGNKAMSFGKSRARMSSENKPKINFADVAGADEAKQDLQEIVEFLKDPGKFQRLGGKIPKGVLLVGPPGTGKTLLARAVAGEASVPFFNISGSEFVEMFVGVGASRVRDLFDQAKKSAPCIIFIDELDSVGRQRGVGLGGGNDEREQTLNQLLVEMDGFEGTEGIILIAATNRPDVLDQALLRPGRFDRQVVVANPDVKGREKILEVHTRNKPLASDVDLKIIARSTPGFSGADLSNLVNEAALLAAREEKLKISMNHFEAAKDKVLLGAERRSLVMSEEERKLTAYHESGHAIVAVNCPASDPIHKATIVPRGRALGLVMRLPERDQVSMPREKMHADLMVAMGGRVAEEIIFGHDKVTSGASQDFKMATNLARRMVMEFGMSEKLGPMSYVDSDHHQYYGQSNQHSDTTAKLIDEEIRKILDTSYADAKQILTHNIKDLHKLANALLEHETLNGEEIKAVLEDRFIKASPDSATATEVQGSNLPT